MSDYYIIGAGGHASVILDILHSNNIEIKGFFADYPKEPKSGYPILGDVNDAVNYSNDSRFIIAIGDNQARMQISQRLCSLTFFSIVHPSAIIGSNVKIGDGTSVFPNAVINSGVTIGNHVILNSGVIIEHDCVIGNYVHISPRAVLCGHVSVGENTWIGAGATIIDKTNIGKNVIIGAGAVVIRDIPDGVKVAGVPAHELTR